MQPEAKPTPPPIAAPETHSSPLAELKAPSGASLFDSLRAQISGVGLALALFGSGEASAAEPPTPVPAVARDPQNASAPIAQKGQVATQDFQSGVEVGRALGKIEVLVGSMRDDIEALATKVEKVGDKNLQKNFDRVRTEIQKDLSEAQAGLDGKVENFDPKRTAEIIKKNAEIIWTWHQLVQARGEVAQPAGQPGAPAVAPRGVGELVPGRLNNGGMLQVEVSDPVTNMILRRYGDKLFAPFDDALGRLMGTPGFEDKGGFPKTDPATLDVARGIREKLKVGLKSDADKIKEQRAKVQAERDAANKAAKP